MYAPGWRETVVLRIEWEVCLRDEDDAKNAKSSDFSAEIRSALGGEQSDYGVAPHSISINREGSGHTFDVSDTIGVVVVGLISLNLLGPLLRSEARYRKLQAELRSLG